MVSRKNDAFERESAPAPTDKKNPEFIAENYCRDLENFSRDFFPDQCRLEFSALHRHLFGRRLLKILRPVLDRDGSLDVVLAPRGAAKSTFVSLIFPIHALMFEHDRHIILISATQHQAQRRIANLKAALLQPRLAAALDSLYPDPARRKILFNARSIEFGDGRIEAHSAGTELRGLSFGPWRPTWIILDDAERSDRVRRALHRDRLYEWFGEVVENLGDRHTHIDIIGTLMHPDALPARLALRPDFAGVTFASILAEAGDQGLWGEWRTRFRNLSDPRRMETARQFYREHQAAMDAGAQVLWEANENYYALCVKRETIGTAAFNKEKQNAPAADCSGIFKRERLHWFALEEGELRPERPSAHPPRKLAELRISGFLDPALGGAGGDFAAIAVVGCDPQGCLYVLDVWLARVVPSEQVTRVYDLHARWGFERFGVETNAFQRLLIDPLEAEREKRRRAGLPHDIPFAPRHHHGSKRERILKLEPLVESCRLLFARGLDRQLLAQLQDFPDGLHDDGPDAIAGAVEIATKYSQEIPQPQRSPRRAGRGGGF